MILFYVSAVSLQKQLSDFSLLPHNFGLTLFSMIACGLAVSDAHNYAKR
jgi:hypothetical protein